jgi:CobQ-like glutamine amidotransferase family enzyme
MPGDTTLSIVEIFPTLLGTYGDRGNPLVVADRARRRGIDVEIVRVSPGSPIPATADLYFVGGAVDAAQAAACDLMRQDGGIADLAARGAPLLAVCAGMQLLGTTFAMREETVDGLGVVDVTTYPGGVRAVGELVTRPSGTDDVAGPEILSGFENHRGLTRRGPGVEPLGFVQAGCGIGNGDGTDGFRAGRILGTYMHGPVLARNPALADLMLSWVAGPLEPLDDHLALSLRDERIEAAHTGRRD